MFIERHAGDGKKLAKFLRGTGAVETPEIGQVPLKQVPNMHVEAGTCMFAWQYTATPRQQRTRWICSIALCWTATVCVCRSYVRVPGSIPSAIAHSSMAESARHRKDCLARCRRSLQQQPRMCTGRMRSSCAVVPSRRNHCDAARSRTRSGSHSTSGALHALYGDVQV